MTKIRCESCDKLNSPKAEKCVRCKKPLSPPSLTLLRSKKKPAKGGDDSLYADDFPGGQLEAIYTFFVRPTEAEPLFFSRSPPPVYLPLFATMVIVSFHAFILTTKIDYTFINGDPVDRSIPIFSNVVYSLFLVIIQYVIGSLVYGLAFSSGFKKDTVGYRRPVVTFFKVNAYIWLIHAFTAVILIFATLAIEQNKVIQFDLGNSTQTTVRDFPSWFIQFDSVLNYLAVFVAAIVLYRTMTKTFGMSNAYGIVGAVITVLPIFFPLIKFV